MIPSSVQSILDDDHSALGIVVTETTTALVIADICERRGWVSTCRKISVLSNPYIASAAPSVRSPRHPVDGQPSRSNLASTLLEGSEHYIQGSRIDCSEHDDVNLRVSSSSRRETKSCCIRAALD